MKVLKALLAVLTTLAVALTAILLFWQDKAPRAISRSTRTSSNPASCTKASPSLSGTPLPGLGDLWFYGIFRFPAMQKGKSLNRDLPLVFAQYTTTIVYVQPHAENVAAPTY